MPKINVDCLMDDAEQRKQILSNGRSSFEMLRQHIRSPGKYDTERKDEQIVDQLDLPKGKNNYLDQSFNSSFFVRS